MKSNIERHDSENPFHFTIEKLIKIAPIATTIIAFLSFAAYIIVNRAQFLNLGFNWQSLFIAAPIIIWILLLVIFIRLPKGNIRIVILILLVISPIVALVYNYITNRETTDKIVVLVSKFVGPNPENYRVTENILDSLREATRKYPEVQIDTLDEIVTSVQGSAYAREKGEEHKPPARIVIWGSYGVTTNIVQMSVNFEMLGKPRYFKIEHEGKGIKEPLARLESFQIQAELSHDLSFLTLFVVGLLRYEADDYKGAIDRFTRALNYSPFKSTFDYCPVVFFYRGFAYQSCGTIDSAIADFDKAIELNPKYASAYINRGLAYANKGDSNSAIANYDKAIELDSTLALAYNNRASVYANKGDSNSAIVGYDKAIELNPKFADAYNNRGIAYKNKGDFNRAIADFDTAIELYPKFAGAYNNRGNAHFIKGDFGKAIPDFDTAIELNPKFAEAYNNRGNAYFNKGDFDKAIADFDKAIELNPRLAGAYNNRGGVYFNRGDFDRAISEYDEAIELNPNFALAYYNRGIAYGNKGDFDQAIADFDKAIELNPKYADAYYNRGITYMKKGDLLRAHEDFKKAKSLDQNLNIPSLPDSQTDSK